MHNVFIHQNKIEKFHVLTQAEGPVANMQAGIGIVRGHGRDVMVINQKNERYDIVHQYDRNSELAVALFEKYVYWDRTEGGKVCSHYELIKGRDVMKGLCDLKPAGGFDPNMCCKVCDKEAGCQAFAHLGGVCFLKTCRDRQENGVYHEAITSGIRKDVIVSSKN